MYHVLCMPPTAVLVPTTAATLHTEHSDRFHLVRVAGQEVAGSCMLSCPGQLHQSFARPLLLQCTDVIKVWCTLLGSSCPLSSASSRRQVALGGLELPRHMLC